MAGDPINNLTSMYSPQYWAGTSSNTLSISTNTTASSGLIEGGWLPATMHKAKQDPFDWLRAETERYVDLGRLDD